jgi:hypothetical protein
MRSAKHVNGFTVAPLVCHRMTRLFITLDRLQNAILERPWGRDESRPAPLTTGARRGTLKNS